MKCLKRILFGGTELLCLIHADEKRGAVQIERVNRHINICPESKQNKIGFFSADFLRDFFFF